MSCTVLAGVALVVAMMALLLAWSNRAPVERPTLWRDLQEWDKDDTNPPVT